MNLKFILLFIPIFIHNADSWKKDQLDLIFDIMDWIASNGKKMIAHPMRVEEKALGLRMNKPFHHVIAEAINMEIPPSGHELAENEIDQRIQFHYAFLVDCVLALNLNKGKYVFNRQQNDYLRSLQTIEHDIDSEIFHGNDCGDVKTKEIFVHALAKTPFNENMDQNVVNYMNNILREEFVNEVKEQLKEGKLDWKNDKTESEYFPQKLPKIFNLITLVNSLASILKNAFPHNVPQLREIFDATVGDLAVPVDLQIHLLRKENPHYKELIEMVKEEELRSKITNLSESMFATMFYENEHLSNRYSKLNVKMMQFLATKMGINPKEPTGTNNLALVYNNIELQKQIAGKILESIKTNGHVLDIKEKVEMLNFLHHRLFCVGLSELINGPLTMASKKLARLQLLLANLEKIKERISKSAGHGHPFVIEHLEEIFDEVCKF